MTYHILLYRQEEPFEVEKSKKCLFYDDYPLEGKVLIAADHFVNTFGLYLYTLLYIIIWKI